MNDRASHAPTASSIYSDDLDELMPDPERSPLASKDSYHPAYHAHPQQHIMDDGPQVRQSRLPIFKQVRSMLHKPPPLVTPTNAKWDEYTGEPSDTGKPAQNVKPSTYTSPYEGAFQARRKSPDRRSKKDLSPISILHDDEEDVRPPAPLKVGRNSPHIVSPVSPVSVDGEYAYAPSPLSANARSLPASVPLPKQVRRKPVNVSPSAIENLPPPRRTSVSSVDSEETAMGEQPESRFSWSTVAPSVMPNRQSTDTMATKHMHSASQSEKPTSRFSWSTVATNTTNRVREESPPPSPPPPVPNHWYQLTRSQQPEGARPRLEPRISQHPAIRQMRQEAEYQQNQSQQPKPQYQPPQNPPPQINEPQPAQYQQPRYRMPEPQSILSRRRPIQRADKEEWSPPARSSSHSPAGTSRTATPGTSTPKTMASSIRSASTSQTQGSGKKLPPPPPPSKELSHMETLVTEEKALLQQRRNIEKVIADLEKVERASPMDVSFATVREAKKKLEENRKTLAEVRREEIELGIKIARARRKEGEEEGLWVRRVTG